jgi:hypothetical protein
VSASGGLTVSRVENVSPAEMSSFPPTRMAASLRCPVVPSSSHIDRYEGWIRATVSGCRARRLGTPRTLIPGKP